MSALFATAGTKIYIGPAKAFSDTDFIASDFTSGDPTYTLIGGTTNLGSFGDTSELISSNHVSTARTRKLKGTRNAGVMQLVCDLDYADPGQLALIAAEKVKETYSFKVELNDAPSGGTPSIRYFVALIMSAGEQLDEANSVMKLNTTLEIDSNIVRVAASGSGSAPDNTALPAITGTAETGETLTASAGTWTGTPTPAYSYQWFSDGESISGATASTYDVQASDEGNVITVQVTANNVNGSASAISAPTATVTNGS